MNFDYVIIGNSAAGIGCAETLRELTDSTIAIISYEKYPAYSRALIPYYLDGKIDFDKLYYRPPNFYEKLNIEPILGKKAVKVDFKNKEVVLEDGDKVGYNKLLIATGGKPFIPPMEGLSNQENVFTFVKLDDVLAIKERLDNKSVEKVVVLGGGIIGLMAAEVLGKKTQVALVTPASRVLVRSVDKIASQLIKNKFVENNVEILFKNDVKKVFGEREVEKVLLSDGRELECDLFIPATGTIPNIDLVKDTDVKINRGIVVDKYMRTSVEDVYAAGDCAEIYDFVYKTNRVLPSWYNAYNSGMTAAFNMVGIKREFTTTNITSLHFYDMRVVSVGIHTPKNGQDLEIIKKFDEKNGVYKKFVLENNRIVGFILANEVERAGIYLNLMRNGIDVSLFKDKLLKNNFGFLDMPKNVKQMLLGDSLKFGIVKG